MGAVRNPCCAFCKERRIDVHPRSPTTDATSHSHAAGPPRILEPDHRRAVTAPEVDCAGIGGAGAAVGMGANTTSAAVLISMLRVIRLT